VVTLGKPTWALNQIQNTKSIFYEKTITTAMAFAIQFGRYGPGPASDRNGD